MSTIAVINGHTYDTDNFYTTANPYAYAAVPPTLGLQQLMIDLATVAAGIAAAAAAGGAFVGAVSMGSTLTVTGAINGGGGITSTSAGGAGATITSVDSRASGAAVAMAANFGGLGLPGIYSVGAFPLFLGTNTTSQMKLFSGGGVNIGSPTGGDKGTGTLNASGSIYVNNSALTCFGIEFLVDGAVDLEKWDGYAATGVHAIAHEFVALTQAGFDPRDPTQYIAKLRGDRALPGMPSQATWRPNDHSLDELQMRSWLATELLAAAWVGSHNDHERRIAILEQQVH